MQPSPNLGNFRKLKAVQQLPHEPFLRLEDEPSKPRDLTGCGSCSSEHFHDDYFPEILLIPDLSTISGMLHSHWGEYYAKYLS